MDQKFSTGFRERFPLSAVESSAHKNSAREDLSVKDRSRSPHSSGLVSRRDFIAQSAATAAAFSIVPRHVLGGVGHVPPSDQVNIAFVGVGAQGLRVMLH